MLRKRIKVAPQHGPAGLRGTCPGACQRGTIAWHVHRAFYLEGRSPAEALAAVHCRIKFCLILSVRMCIHDVRFGIAKRVCARSIGTQFGSRRLRFRWA